ncbi:hypothetical protein ABN063_06035 [Providencia vermicola]|uniref:hypothetical protein n=1 Tax=Providencia vermicola TaxID=333965 RepID=UPI0032DB1177
MQPHIFSNLMLKVYEILELFPKGINRRDIREHTNFLSHQYFFTDGYESIINTIDLSRALTIEKRKDIFFRYEQLYNKLISTEALTDMTPSEVVRRYAQLAIPAIIALDMHMTLNYSSRKDIIHFYRPIRNFFRSKHYINNNDNSSNIFQAVKDYLREYIETLQFNDKAELNHIRSYIRKITAEKNQKTSTIRQLIKICISDSKDNGIQCDDLFDKLETTYTSLNYLLIFHRKTNWTNSVSMEYYKIINNDMYLSSVLPLLKIYLYTFEYSEQLLHECTTAIIYNSYVRSKKITSLKTHLFIIKKIKDIVFDYKNIIYYSEDDFTKITIFLNQNKDTHFLAPYSNFFMALCLLRHEKYEDAYQHIQKISLNTLPLGYLTSAISIISLSLTIQLKKKPIKNGTFIPLINPILSSQGVFTEHLPSPVEPFNYSILKDANNITIMRSIKLYNTMILKINHLVTKNNDVYPKAIIGLLDEIEIALGKIRIAIDKTNTLPTENDFANIIINDKILTEREISQNLIGILSNCTLSNCINCLQAIFHYLRCFGEEPKLINILYYVDPSDKRNQEKKLIMDSLFIANEILCLNS